MVFYVVFVVVCTITSLVGHLVGYAFGINTQLPSLGFFIISLISWTISYIIASIAEEVA